MILCKECKYWNNKGADGKIYRKGDCSSDKWLAGYHLNGEEIPDDGILVENDEGWGFIVGPNFGCIHASR